MLYRKVEKKITEWIENSKKALLIDGARQVGKTFIIRKVLRNMGCEYVEFNLLKTPLITKQNLNKEKHLNMAMVFTWIQQNLAEIMLILNSILLILQTTFGSKSVKTPEIVQQQQELKRQQKLQKLYKKAQDLQAQAQQLTTQQPTDKAVENE